MRVLIIGFGKLGQQLGLRLNQLGHQVTGLKRQPVELPGIRCISANISDPQSLQDLSTDYDQVVCMLSAGSRDPEAYRAIYETGLHNVQQWLAVHSCQAPWLFVSSTSAYGQQSGEWVDEDSATVPASDTANLLLAAEQRVLSEGPNNTIVRFSGIYGGNRRWLLGRVRQGIPVQHEPPVYTNRIHQDDCVEALVFLLDKWFSGHQLASVYLASDHQPAPQWEVHCWLAEQMGCALPEPLRADGLTGQNKRCRNQRLVDLGFVFRYPGYREGYAGMLA